MDESGRKKRDRVREPPSVPFLWEAKPGIPKKDWKPEVSSSVPQIFKTPLKLIASVPFAWEEKPGKPIPGFTLNSAESIPPNIEVKLVDVASPSYSGYSAACKYGCDENDKESSSDSNYVDGSDSDDSIIGRQLDAFSFETDESAGSQPSLLANCLVPSAKISTAIPLQKNPLTEQNNDHLETSSSTATETGSSTSSYETGHSSLVGASFLESLFPLFPPNSGFLEKAAGYSENTSLTPLELTGGEFDGEDYTSVMVRRPPTLGELIMMSRRRSCRRKAVQMKKWDLQRVIPPFFFLSLSTLFLLKTKFLPCATRKCIE